MDLTVPTHPSGDVAGRALLRPDARPGPEPGTGSLARDDRPPHPLRRLRRERPARADRRAGRRGRVQRGGPDRPRLAGRARPRPTPGPGARHPPGPRVRGLVPVAGHRWASTCWSTSSRTTTSPLGLELVRLREDRRRRNLALADRLASLGIPLTYDMVVAEAGGEAGVGRPHFASVMVEVGAADSVDDAFDRYLTNRRPGIRPEGTALGGRRGPAGPGLGWGGGAGPPLQHRVSRATTWPRPVGELAEAGLGRASRPSTAATRPGSAKTWATWPGGSTWWPPAAPTITG